MPLLTELDRTGCRWAINMALSEELPRGERDSPEDAISLE
jgi:hypothetical protein